MFQGFPLLFVSVNGKGFREKDGTSYGNQTEVKVVMHYLKMVSKMIEHSEIGVISPYKCQTRMICQKLRKSSVLDGSQITVDSVEKFQGSERKAIIITGTRTSSNLGFIGDDLVSFNH